MPIVINKKKCTGCKLCLAACPYAAVKVVKKKAVLSEECTQCGACMNSCEFNAITFKGSQKRIKMDLTSFKGIYVFVEQDNETISNVSL